MAREAFGGATFQTHVELAGAIGAAALRGWRSSEALLASPQGPVPMDREIVGRRWPRDVVAAEVARWAPSANGPIIALAEDEDAMQWREQTSGLIHAPLVGVSPLQRRVLVGLIAAGAELPDWAPAELALILATFRAPMPAPAPEATAEAEDEPTLSGRPQTTLPIKTIRAEAAMMRLLVPEAPAVAAQRPRTRGDCIDGPRPCPWVGCKHNLYLDVMEGGGLMVRQPGVEVWDVKGPSCSLDVVDAHPHGMILADLGDMLGITRERVRQIEKEGLKILRASGDVPRDMPEEPEGWGF